MAAGLCLHIHRDSSAANQGPPIAEGRLRFGLITWRCLFFPPKARMRLASTPAVGSTLVADHTASRRKIHGKPTAPSRLPRFVYWLHWLLRQIQQGLMPRHVGIILDGNRRHARRRGLGDPREIYQIGANKLDDALDWCAELGIGAVTLWVFSTERSEID